MVENVRAAFEIASQLLSVQKLCLHAYYGICHLETGMSLDMSRDHFYWFVGRLEFIIVCTTVLNKGNVFCSAFDVGCYFYQ